MLPTRLIHIPIGQTNLENLTWAQQALCDEQISDKRRRGLEFILELMRWHRRFDIQLGEAQRHIEVGEFDIEIDG